MASSPVYLLLYILAILSTVWIFFNFAARILARLLGKLIKATVRFRFAGLLHLRDVSVCFTTGPLDSIMVGEIHLKLQLARMNFSALSQESKLNLCCSEVEVFLRKPYKSQLERGIRPELGKRRKPKKSKSWLIVARWARHVNVTVTELVVRAIGLPDLSLEIEALGVYTFRPGDAALDFLEVKLVSGPVNIPMRDVHHGDDNRGLCNENRQSRIAIKRYPMLFSLEQLSVTSNLEYIKDMGLIVQQVEVNFDELEVNLSEDLFQCTGLVGNYLHKNAGDVDTSYGVMLPEGHIAVKNKASPQKPEEMVGKYISWLPEKIGFNLQMFSLNFYKTGEGSTMTSSVSGISVRTCILKSTDDNGKITAVCDMQLDCRDIHLLEGSEGSLLQIKKVSIVVTTELHPKINFRQRVEINATLEGTQCNLFLNIMDNFLKFCLRLPKRTWKQEQFLDGSSPPMKKKLKSTLCWVCTVSAPEISVAAYDNLGITLFRLSSQSLQFFVDNVSGPPCRMQLEVGELQVMMVDEIYDDCMSSTESSAIPLICLGGLVMEWGTSELRFEDYDESLRRCSVIIVECSLLGAYLSAVRLQGLLAVGISLERYMKNILEGKLNDAPRSSTISKLKTKGGWRKVKFCIQGLSIQFCGPAAVDEVDVIDPKILNLGDQGGKVVLTHNHDGVLRTALIKATDKLKENDVLFRATFEELFGLVSLDNHTKNLQFSIDRSLLSHEELGLKTKVISKLTVLAVQTLEVLYEEKSHDAGFCGRLLISMRNADGHWNPDMHLFYYGVALQLASLRGQLKGKARRGIPSDEARNSPGEKQDTLVANKKASGGMPKLTLAMDFEKLKLTAKVTEEIDFALHVQSLVSEDLEIGLLVENVHVTINQAEVLVLEGAQICRLPCSTPAVNQMTVTKNKIEWKVSIQATKIRIIMPFRIQLRAIEDAVEDMWRVLKLVMQTQKVKWKPLSAVVGQHKIKKPCAQVKCVHASVHYLSFEIEEDPLQGWLDEHHHLLGREVCKLLVQERILEEKRQQEEIKQRSDVQSMPASQTNSEHSTFSLMTDPEREKMQKETFRAYRRACESLVLLEGSGVSRGDQQSGFRMSYKRRSLLLVQASKLEMNLSLIKESLIETIRKLDCVSPDIRVPYARVYGRYLSIQASSLLAQLRDFSSPLMKMGLVECDGNVIVAQQATSFPPQIRQEVKLGRSRTVEVWRSISGSTPAYKTFLDLNLEVNSGRFSYGVGYEPVIADVSYAFSIALQKAKPAIPVIKNERSLSWWDDMRYYIHGRNSLKVNDFSCSLLATTNPYEDQQLLQFVATTMEVEQSEGSIIFRADDFEWVIMRSSSACQSHELADDQEKLSVLHAPEFKLEITMDWKCESGKPLNHYLHSFPNDANPPIKKFDLFRSTSLSLTFSFSLFCPTVVGGNVVSPLFQRQRSNGQLLGRGHCEKLSGRVLGGRKASHHSERSSDLLHALIPTIYFGSEELKWIFHLWNLFYSPPHKLRSFSRWPRFGIKRVARSGNLSLDKVMTEFLLQVDATPGCIKHRTNLVADPAQGLTFHMERLRYELLYSRCQGHFESSEHRDPLMSVYQGLDFSMLNADLGATSVPILTHGEEFDRKDKVKELLGLQEGTLSESIDWGSGCKKLGGRSFLLSMDCFTLRKQAPKAGLSQLSALLHYKKLSHIDGSATLVTESTDVGSGSDHIRSDESDDEGFSVVLADNCLRVSVYGLKLLWTLPNRDAVWSWVEDFSRAFESPKPSPSRQSAQRQVLEMNEQWITGRSSNIFQGVGDQSVDTLEEEGVMHFMVNVVQPQFNLHSEDAHGRLLLAAASGRVLARSFHSIVAVGLEVIANALRRQGVACNPQGGAPVIAWKRRELSVILEHVQAHVAPTDVDLGAGLQWLSKIPTWAPKVRRTGALLERVFMPCSMYFQYTRHKGGTTDCKVKPLKELSFNSPNITATMTSNQFHIIVDVISNLLLARLPKPRNRPSLQNVGEEDGKDEEGDEEVDEVVPEGVEEVEIARIKLEQAERDCHAILEHWVSMRHLGFGLQSVEIKLLEKEFALTRRVRRTAFVKLRATLQSAAQLRLREKEKHRTPLAAMRISWAIDKFVWSMLCDGEYFAEAEISSMILNVDRDFNDVGVARFTTKSFAVKNCLSGAKSSMVLSPWNPPVEWGRNVMLRVDAKQGAPKDEHSPLELFQVEIYPLRIYLSEGMYTMMWEYLFPEEDPDFLKRQSVRIQHQKVNLTASISNPVSQGRNASIIRTLNEKEIDLVSIDGVNTKGSGSPLTTISRALTASSLQNCSLEDSLSALSAHPSLSVESVKSKEQKIKKGSKMLVQENKKISEEKKVTCLQKRLLEFHNIRISQVELLVTYEGSRFSVNDMRLLMDTFTRMEFTGSWRRLFSKVKKHIIWSVLKSLTGMQGKKFKDKLPAQTQADGDEAGDDSNSSDSSTSQGGHEDQYPLSRFRRHSDRAGEGFVSSIRGLFNSQRRKAKALVMRTLSIDLRNNSDSSGYVSGGDADSATSPQEFGNLSNAKWLLQRHSRKLRLTGSQKGSVFSIQSQSSSSSSLLNAEAELSDGSSAYEDFHE